MKGLVKQVKSLIIFDFPIQAEYISAQFARTHQQFQSDKPEWSTEATRQKLISHYWHSYVPRHFALLTGLPSVIVMLIHPIVHSNFYMGSILIAELLSFGILYVFHYQPSFSAVFLPNLETVKEAFECKQMEKLEKCRQAQLSNFSLALFFYVIASTNNIDSIKCDDYSANLLMKLYGVDAGSLKKNLELIFGTRKRKNLSDRKLTEIRNRFSETYAFLEGLGYNKGIQKLKELETTFFCAAHRTGAG
jgi:hypothetical protein